MHFITNFTMSHLYAQHMRKRRKEWECECQYRSRITAIYMDGHDDDQVKDLTHLSELYNFCKL